MSMLGQGVFLMELPKLQGRIFQKIACNVLNKRVNLGRLRIVKMVLVTEPAESSEVMTSEKPSGGSGCGTVQDGEVQAAT